MVHIWELWYRSHTSLWRPLVLGKNLNRWGQWKTSVVLVALLVVIGQHRVDVKGWVVGLSSSVGAEGMVLVAFLAKSRQLGVDVEGQVIVASDIFSK